jgi:hypothetical protein
MPGAQCTRSLVCAWCSKNAHEYSQRRHRKSPGIPARNGFNGLLRDLPGDRALLPPSSRGFKVLSGPVEPHAPPRDLTPASRRQDHTTSPSANRLSKKPPDRLGTSPVEASAKADTAPSSCVSGFAHGEQSAPRSHRTPNAAASTASHPAFRDDRDTPLLPRRDVGDETSDLGVVSRRFLKIRSRDRRHVDTTGKVASAAD